MRHFTAPIPWAFLSDAEWHALAPFVARATTVGGRPLRAAPIDWLTPGPDPTLRHRFDAMLYIAVSGDPWRALPQAFGRADTVARFFRRLTHAGLWPKLLFLLRHATCPPALKKIEYWLCRLARRAMRLLGMRGLEIARALGLLSALPQVPWRLPDRGLSDWAFAQVDATFRGIAAGTHPPPGWLGLLRRALLLAGGHHRWPTKFAPP